MTTTQLIILLKIMKIFCFIAVGLCVVAIPVLIYLLWRLHEEI